MTADDPDVATYKLASGDRAPMWLAVYVDNGVRLPSTFQGSTEIEAYAAAVDFWADQQRLIAKARVARGDRAV